MRGRKLLLQTVHVCGVLLGVVVDVEAAVGGVEAEAAVGVVIGADRSRCAGRRGA